MASRDFQVILNNANNLPEDRYVNTLYYDQGDKTLEQVMDGIAGAYQNNLQSTLGGQISSMTIKAYTPGLNVGGPLAEKGYAFDPQVAGGPAEVAVCLSYYAGQNSPRRRGRIYVGPFNGSNLGTERPGAGLMGTLISFGNALAAVGANSLANWEQHSRVDGSYNAVSNFYVDNAWDTQRRRGAAPSGRTLGSV